MLHDNNHRRAGGLKVAPEEEIAHQEFVERHEEEANVSNDIGEFSCLAALALFPVLAFGMVFLNLLGLRDWAGTIFTVLGFPIVMAPKLYGYWRLYHSSLPVRIRGVLITGGRERKHMFIIAAIITVAVTLLYILSPNLANSLSDW